MLPLPQVQSRLLGGDLALMTKLFYRLSRVPFLTPPLVGFIFPRVVGLRVETSSRSIAVGLPACAWHSRAPNRLPRTRGCRRTRKARTTTRIARRRRRRGPTSWTGSSPRCSRTHSTSRRSSRSCGACRGCWFVRRRRRSRLATEIVRTKTKVDAYLDRVL